MRAKDWSATRLGPIAEWPQSLRTSVSISLNSQFAILIWWGPDLVMLYNDAYSKLIGLKHPIALGQMGRDCFTDIWNIVGPMLQDVMRSGEATWSDDLLLLLERHGYAEECYFTFSYSPIRDETGGIGGIFTPVTETTSKVIGQRRLRTLRDLAARSVEARTVDEGCRIVTTTLAENPYDIPFALLYLLSDDRRQARLAGAAGIEPDLEASPEVVELDERPEASPWSLTPAFQTAKPLILEQLDAGSWALPTGVWPDPPDQALVLPVTLPGKASPVAALVAAISPRKALDSEYRTFFELIAGQVGATLAEAMAYEEERKRAEALAELDRAKTSFFSNVSHEFRTPLTLILGPLEDALVAPDHSLDRESLEAVHRNSLRLLRLVNTLLDFSRIEEHRMQALYQPVELCAVTADIASAFRSAVERAGLQLIVNCQPLAEPVFVDPDMWEKIVLNLISNAFKFTLRGEIEVGVRQDGYAAQLWVRDTGIGIPAAQIRRLFERFHRVESAEGRTHEGTGIGLALVRELVRLHGGAVAVESATGEGSTFTVTIPLGTDHIPEDRIVERATANGNDQHIGSFIAEADRWADMKKHSATGPSVHALEFLGATEPKRARILLADDNSDMRDYVERILAKYYQVETVADGEAALAAIHRSLPDLLLSDVMMPALDGIQLLRALRSDPSTSSLPIILLSARAGEEAGIEGLQAGADDYLIKPFSARELTARIAAQLRIAEVRDQARALLSAAYDHEHRIAETFQNALFAIPGEDTFASLALSGVYESALEEAEVGGDFIDAFALPGEKVALVVGDVSGKGLAAAARTAQIRFTLRSFLREDPQPAAALCRLNNALYDAQVLDKDEPEGFACLALAVFETDTGSISFSSAGAEPPIIVRAAGATEEIAMSGTPLAVARDMIYPELCTTLAPNDTVLLVTDGITEARREKEFFGFERLLEAAARARSSATLADMAREIVSEAKAFGGSLRD
ncbi:MAG TPA: SpoIIE family protein phosphatase, partial [Capsulimonadaceae bacterium]|nr:SpoIIE family protein phosphatase [Capsulimonadaceae bacterium]